MHFSPPDWKKIQEKHNKTEIKFLLNNKRKVFLLFVFANNVIIILEKIRP